MERTQQSKDFEALVKKQYRGIRNAGINDGGVMFLEVKSAKTARTAAVDLMRAGLAVDIQAPDSRNPYCSGLFTVRARAK